MLFKRGDASQKRDGDFQEKRGCIIPGTAIKKVPWEGGGEGIDPFGGERHPLKSKPSESHVIKCAAGRAKLENPNSREAGISLSERPGNYVGLGGGGKSGGWILVKA